MEKYTNYKKKYKGSPQIQRKAKFKVLFNSAFKNQCQDTASLFIIIQIWINCYVQKGQEEKTFKHGPS